MKKPLLILLIYFALIGTLVAQDFKKSLIGTWRLEKINQEKVQASLQTSRIIFYENGKYEQWAEDQHLSGDWEFQKKGKKIIFKPQGANQEWVEIKELTENELIVSDASSKRISLSKQVNSSESVLQPIFNADFLQGTWRLSEVENKAVTESLKNATITFRQDASFYQVIADMNRKGYWELNETHSVILLKPEAGDVESLQIESLTSQELIFTDKIQRKYRLLKE
jgi:Lipocalin-like domain